MSPDKKLTEAIIEDVYAAALGEQSWCMALDGVRRLTASRMAALLTLDASGRTCAVDAAADDLNWATELQDSYNHDFHRYDPTSAVVGDWAVGRWYDDRQWNLPAQRARSLYHQEFLRPRHVSYWEGTFIHRSEDVMHFLSLQADGGSPETPSCQHRLVELQSHLGRAMRMQQQLQGLQGQLADAESALDALCSPLFILDDCRRLLRTNAAARSLIAREPGLRFLHGRLHHPAMEADVWREACRLGVLTLRRKPPQPPLLLTLTPLPARSPLVKDWQRPLTLMLAPGDRSPVERQRHMRALFGLTPAEAEVCISICTDGLSPQDCADLREVSVGTIRSQIKAIFLKTGVTRLADLVRTMNAM